jgi:hypothetical protein
MNVGIRTGVFVIMEASVVETASSTGNVGAVVLDGNEQDVRISNNKIIVKIYFIRRLYSFSEQIDAQDVLRIKERK